MRCRSPLPIFLIAFTLSVGAGPAGAAPKPPVAKRVEKRIVQHGEERVDPYFWLREKQNPEVAAYLRAENAYADAVLQPLQRLQGRLYTEMRARLKETDLSAPYRERGYWYYARSVKGKQYQIHCRKKGSLQAPEQVLLDLNAMAKGRPFLSLGPRAVSDDGHLLAYSLDTTGFREYRLSVKDLRTGRLLPDRLERVDAVLWGADNRTLFYVTEDRAKRPYRFYRHTLGRPQAEDELLYEEKDELFRLEAKRSDSRRLVLLTTSSFTSSEVRYLRADRPAEPLKLVLPRAADREYYVEDRGDRFLIRVNDTGRNFRLVKAPLADPQPENWQPVTAHQPDAKLEGVRVFRDHLVVQETASGQSRFRVTDLRSGRSHWIRFPEPVYAAFPAENREPEARTFRLTYQSLLTPPMTVDYDMGTRQWKVLKRTTLRRYRPADYVSERVWARAEDGTRIPVSLVYRRGLKRDGRAPLLLEGYGAYGWGHPTFFEENRVSLLDRGVVYGIAHVRGGGELGQPWHDAGRMLNKRNTFTDFIAAAEHLVREGYADRKRIAISGGSAGGLLVGAVANMRPELFRVVLSYVPFVDVVNTMSDPTLPLTVPEYQEWGNPGVKAEYDYIRSYCPYTNLAAKSYPAMLVRTSFNDSQVMYWEPAKYVAKLRSLKTDARPLLFKVNMMAGHGGASGRYDALRDVAFDYAFLITQLGVTAP